jgi:N-acetylglutamate synthase-like GNAT family acetyltransferase
MEIHRFSVNERNAIRKDIPKLQKMCGHFTPIDTWMDKQMSSASDILYAVKDKEVLGFLIADNRKTHIQIELICVGEKGRALKGIGTTLMKEAEKIAKSYSLPEVHLESQFDAEPFYKKLNYKETERDEYGISMKKNLV